MTDLSRMNLPDRCWEDAFQQCTHGIAIIQVPTNLILACNAALAGMVGLTADQLVGCSMLHLHPPEERDHVEQAIEVVYREGRFRYETWMLRSGASPFPVQVDTVCVRDDAGERLYRIATVQDITTRREAEAALREQEEKLRSIVNAAKDAIITADEHGAIVQINSATEQMFGYTEAELLGNNLRMLMPSPFREEHDDYMRRYLRTGEKRIIGIGREVMARRKDGSTFPIDLIVSEFQDGKRYFTGIIRDITERKRLQAEVLRIAEDEQRRLGEELHDDIQQQLTGLLLLTKHIAKAMKRPDVEGNLPVELLARVDRLIQGLRDASQSVRALSHRLVPAAIVNSGLREALKNLTAEVHEQRAVDCSLAWDGAVDVDDPFVAMHLYRIVQEAVTNALKHSQARRIEVACRLANDILDLRIGDDGIGIAPHRPARGRGVNIMAYRAGVIGGMLSIHPGDIGGTVVHCAVPLNSLPSADNNQPVSIQHAPSQK